MAITFSYPTAIPVLTDTIIGNKYYEGEGFLTKSFTITSIAALATGTLQTITTNGNVTTLPITAQSFVKTGGVVTEYLMANGTSSTLTSSNITTAYGYTIGRVNQTSYPAVFTGTTAEVIINVAQLAQGFIGYYSPFEVKLYVDKGIANAGTSVLRMYANSVNSTSGATLIATYNLAQVSSAAIMTRLLANVGGGPVGGFPPGVPSQNGTEAHTYTVTSTGGGLPSVGIQYLLFTMQNASASDAIQFKMVRITS